jgi:hypothetical protein
MEQAKTLSLNFFINNKQKIAKPSAHVQNVPIYYYSSRDTIPFSYRDICGHEENKGGE